MVILLISFGASQLIQHLKVDLLHLHQIRSSPYVIFTMSVDHMS